MSCLCGNHTQSGFHMFSPFTQTRHLKQNTKVLHSSAMRNTNACKCGCQVSPWFSSPRPDLKFKGGCRSPAACCYTTKHSEHLTCPVPGEVRMMELLLLSTPIMPIACLQYKAEYKSIICNIFNILSCHMSMSTSLGIDHFHTLTLKDPSRRFDLDKSMYSMWPAAKNFQCALISSESIRPSLSWSK